MKSDMPPKVKVLKNLPFKHGGPIGKGRKLRKIKRRRSNRTLVVAKMFAAVFAKVRWMARKLKSPSAPSRK